jgi:hypothetical protein
MPIIKPKDKQQNGASPSQELDSNQSIRTAEFRLYSAKEIIANTGLHDEAFRIHQLNVSLI